MKIDENRSKVATDESELTRQVKKQVEYKKLGDHIRSIDGGKIWKISKEDNSISEALYRESLEFAIGTSDTAKKVDIEKGYWYVEALNRTNALKKLKQGKIILST
jgi:hypothetical protein